MPLKLYTVLVEEADGRRSLIKTSGSRPEEAGGHAMEEVAEDSERMLHLSPSDDEYETELSMAIDDLKGCLVYEGHHDDITGLPVVHEEGEIGLNHPARSLS